MAVGGLSTLGTAVYEGELDKMSGVFTLGNTDTRGLFVQERFPLVVTELPVLVWRF